MKKITTLPKHLRQFQALAQNYVSAGYVRDIEFSRGTYQVLVFDPEMDREEWVFLQLDAKGNLKDSFCACCESEMGHGCVHLAAAVSSINGQSDVPLHIRFESSLWNCLCLYCSENIGNSPESVHKKAQRQYFCQLEDGTILFSVKAGSAEVQFRLDDIFFNRKAETEDTSLKFSNLSLEDINLWRQGRPTPKLSYELSFWNDLAKLLMRWQEEDVSYTISFQYSSNKLPNSIKIAFSELELEVHLFEDYLPIMIPSLRTVTSPLAVYDTPIEDIAKMVYHKEKRSLQILPKQYELMDKDKSTIGINIPGWTFIEGDGFYSRDKHFLLSSEELTGNALEKALDEYAVIIKGLIQGCKIHGGSIPLSYTLAFDSSWNLHISGYLFSPNDLSTGDSYCLNSWVYLDGDGFYHLEDRYFEDLETTVLAAEVSDFVIAHRAWLNNQKGFGTHLSPLEADIVYEVNTHQQLIFSRELSKQVDEADNKDFGRWVYVEGQGFFSKKSMQSNGLLHGGKPVAPDQISLFIRGNYTDLCLVKRFFIERCPIVKSTLNISLNKNEEVVVIPEYELLPQYQNKSLLFFDEFVYVQGEGFSEIPSSLRLPERFREPILIASDKIPHFLQVELPSLESFVNHIDSKLCRPKHCSLVANSIDNAAQEGKADYSLQLKYRTEYGTISVASLWWPVKKNKRFVFSEAGLIDLSDKKFSWLKTLQKERVDRRGNHIELTTLELMRLNATDEITFALKDVSQQSQQLLDELKTCRVAEEPDLTGLKSQLRSYQQKGVDWLWFLYRHGLSGLLCDDMGLGKTHQTMALLMAVANYWRKHADGKKRHFLIICPTSVIYHWQEKLNDFLPELKVWTFYGAKRSLESFYENSDILLTSYGVWRNEIDLFANYTFEVAIFDEVQIAKNHASRVYQTLTMAKVRMRIGLSGTPIENHLRELKNSF